MGTDAGNRMRSCAARGKRREGKGREMEAKVGSRDGRDAIGEVIWVLNQ